MLRMMLVPGGRIVSVGDPAQAIFGFTGAESDSLDRIRKDFDCVTFPLSVSYRCPKAVVTEAQTWVSHIESAPDAPEGSVIKLTDQEFRNQFFSTLSAADVILCRNTKPLVDLAYTLLGAGVGCRIEGKDIGTGLLKLISKWKRIKTVSKLRDKLVNYCEVETAKALAKGQEYKAASVSDRVDCLLTIMDTLADNDKVDMIEAKINAMFGDTPPGQLPNVLTLSTIHKAKGREWARVFWYGRNEFQPSPYARQAWQQDQERNLMYVAATRAKSDLIVIETNLRAKKGGE
jgi:superfamily I DNA/RNA helicase